MEKYQSFIPSKIQWVNKVPSNWIEKKNKHIFIENKEVVGSEWKNYQLLSLSKRGVIKRDIENGKGKFPESFENYKKIEKDDLIFCLYDIEETPRTVGLSDFYGMITGSYKVFKCIENPKFVYYWYLTIDDFKGLKPFYTGMRNVVRPETFLSLNISLPPSLEQKQIVQFLDEKTELIDKLISTKERKINLLKEQRTSIINQVVTKGLNPNVKMKNSGVEWIGEIPEGWKISKFKFDTKTPVQYGLNISGDKYLEEGIRFIRITDLLDSGGLITDNGKYLHENDVPKEFLLNKFDVLFCRTGHTVGKSYLHLEDGSYTSGGYLVRFNFENYVESKFVFYISKTSFYWDWIKLNSVVSTIENVNGDKFQNFQYPKPTKLEQNEIVEFLDSKTKEIDDLVQLEQKKIDLLKEYRQSLISEVVTGKIKVTN